MSNKENITQVVTKNKHQLVISVLESRLTKSLFVALMVVSLGILLPEVVLAEFNLDKAGSSIANPVKSFIDTYWPVGVLALGSGGAIIAQGDLRTKALGFGVGSLLAGLMMAGVKGGLGL